MERSYQKKEVVPQMNNEDILVVQRDVFSTDTNYLDAKMSAIEKLAIAEKQAHDDGRIMSDEERDYILRAPIAQYIAERAPIFRFFAEHLSDPEAIMHFKKAAETHDQDEVASILSLFEEFRVKIETAIAKTDPEAWDSLIHAIEKINIHPELQDDINRIFEQYLNKD